MNYHTASVQGISKERTFLLNRPNGRGIKPDRSLCYRSGSVRLNDYEYKIIVSLIKTITINFFMLFPMPLSKKEQP